MTDRRTLRLRCTGLALAGALLAVLPGARAASVTPAADAQSVAAAIAVESSAVRDAVRATAREADVGQDRAASPAAAPLAALAPRPSPLANLGRIAARIACSASSHCMVFPETVRCLDAHAFPAATRACSPVPPGSTTDSVSPRGAARRLDIGADARFAGRVQKAASCSLRSRRRPASGSTPLSGSRPPRNNRQVHAAAH